MRNATRQGSTALADRRVIVKRAPSADQERCVVEERSSGEPRRAEEESPAPVVPELSPIGARLTRLAVRAAVAAAAGVIAGGLLAWEAGLLVAGLAVLTYVLLAGLAPRDPMPRGTQRLLRSLQRRGHYIVSLPGDSRYLAVGPAGVHLLDTRHWRRPVAWTDSQWRIGDVPARRLAHRAASRAEALERRLRLRDHHPDLEILPVIVVGGKLPEPLMRSGRAVIARPRAVVDLIARRPEVVAESELDGLVTAIGDRLAVKD
jgi:hypothetical protein